MTKMTWKEYQNATKEEIYSAYVDEFQDWAENGVELGWRGYNNCYIDNWREYLSNKLWEIYVFKKRTEKDWLTILADFVDEIWREYVDELIADDITWNEFIDWLELESYAPTEFDDEED